MTNIEPGLTEIKTKLVSIAFAKDNFAIFRSADGFSVKGKFADDPKHLLNVNLSLIGKWSTSSYGRDFTVSRYVIEEDQLFHFMLRVVGHMTPAVARELTTKFADRIDEVIETCPDELLTVKGIGKKKRDRIVESWERNKHLYGLARILSPFGVTTNQIIRIAEHFGENAHDVLLQNPYRLIEIRGVGFRIADDVARRIGISHDALERMIACAEFVMLENRDGHTIFMPHSVIQLMQQALLTEEHEDVPELLCRQGITGLIESGRAEFAEFDGLIDEGITENKPIAMSWNVALELKIGLALSCSQQFGAIVADIDAWIATYEKENKVLFGDEQRDAIRLANAGNGIFSISGYAGTGKTTTSKAILQLICERFDKNEIYCCALAGIAANRIRMQSGFAASTIHSMLGFKGNDWEHDEDNKLPARVVMLDESSMVDIDLMYRLFSAIDFETTTLIMLGDPAQLPPVGLGQPFADLLKHKLIPNVTLTRIYRQSADAVITSFAADVRHGQVPQVYGQYDDFQWHDHSIKNYWDLKKSLPQAEFNAMRDANNFAILQDITLLARGAHAAIQALKAKGDMWGATTRFQVVSPIKETPIGVKRLNSELQSVFNPSAPEGQEITRNFDNRIFRPGDKVVHLRNMGMRPIQTAGEIELWRKDELPALTKGDFKLRIMNGQVGVVREVAHGEMLVDFPIERVTILYEETDINSLAIDLGYALTVHKTQGSEYAEVVMPITVSHWMMLNPQLIYTAMTRAKTKLHLVGQIEAFRSGCRNKEEQMRRTCLNLWYGDAVSVQEKTTPEPAPALEIRPDANGRMRRQKV